MSNRTIKWRNAWSFVLMIGWTTAMFKQAQRFWSSDSDLDKNNVILALISIALHFIRIIFQLTLFVGYRNFGVSQLAHNIILFNVYITSNGRYGR